MQEKFTSGHLSKLSPAEAEVVLNGTGTEFTVLLKYTLFDLIIRKILKIEEEKKQANHKERIRQIQYIKKGEKFDNYVPLSHERIFIQQFQNETYSVCMLQHLVRHVCSEVEESYTEIMIKNPVMRELFHTSLWNYLAGGFSLTARGRKVRSELRKEIKQTEKLFSKWLLNRDARCAEIYQALQGNIVHLKNLAPGIPSMASNPFLAEFDVYASTLKRKNDDSPGFFRIPF